MIECPVLLPEGVWIALRRVSSWGIRMELLRIAMHAPCRQGEGSLHHAHADDPPCDVPSSPDIPHSEFCPGDIPPSLDISHPADISGWKRRAFQLPRSDIFGSADSAYPENFTAIFAQCHGVLLKLPDICDQHFEIFCFRYLMSKSPNSPCNPPIIGFLSL